MTISLSFDQITAPAQTDADTDAEYELERLAEDALVADMNFKEAETKKNDAKAAFKKALEARGQLNPDTKAVGVVRTIVKRIRRFDKALAAQLLTAEEIAKYSTIDSAVVKANVAPNVYEMFQKDSGYSLEVKVAD